MELLEARPINKNKQELEEPISEKAKASKNELIEKYLVLKYDFRFNTIKQKPEFRQLGENSRFVPVDKYSLNSFKRELDANGLNSSSDNIKQILESSFSDRVNPIKDYFLTLPQWKGEDFIKTLSDTVQVRNSEKWYEYLKKWLVAVVANAMTDEGCQNHTCLVLTGEQGKFKTTWLDNLCPRSLSNYKFTGKIDPNNKDSLTYIAEFLFINIDDQLRQLNKKDENELKNLITAPSVKYRRPYDPYITEYPHTASFMASVNGNDFLTDPTGSRRFLPFEALGIDINASKALDMDKVYSQAMTLFKAGFSYWFNDLEIQELFANNQLFQVTSIEEQLLIHYFKKPDHRENATHTYSTAFIQSLVEQNTKQRLSTKRLGEALTRLGFEKYQKQTDNVKQWVWAVIQKEGAELELQTKNENSPF